MYFTDAQQATQALLLHITRLLKHSTLCFLNNPQNKGLHYFRATNLSHTLVASGVQYKGSGKTCGQKLFSLLLKEALYSYFWGEVMHLYMTVGL